MIEKLRGRCIHKLPNRLIIDVNGVGYSVEVPLPLIHTLNDQLAETELWIYTHIREDILKLYGFLRYEEKVAFTILISLSGVGPKMAMAILSAMSLEEMVNAVMVKNEDAFKRVSGVGARTAEKLIVELKSKLEKLDKELMSGMQYLKGGDADLALRAGARAISHGFDAFQFELISALENLGFKAAQVKPILQRVCEEQPQADFSQILKLVLSKLTESKTVVDKSALDTGANVKTNVDAEAIPQKKPVKPADLRQLF